MARISGNDISKFQGAIDWNTYKNNSNFVIMKATEGVGYTDPLFKTNQDAARNVNLPLGYYHYARPDLGNTPEKEAQYFLDIIGELRDGEVMALDYEVPKNQAHVEWCKKWCEYVFNKTGTRPLMYMSESYVTGLDWSALVSFGSGLWIAKYLNNPTPDASYNTGKWGFAAMYQWTSKQVVPGIGPVVDGDVFYGDQATFKKYGYKKPVPPPPPIDYQALYNAEVQKNKELESKLNTANTQIAVLQTKIDNARQALA